jgi:hypothetical protein
MIKKFLQTLRAKSNDVCPFGFTRIPNYELVDFGVEGIVSEQFV